MATYVGALCGVGATVTSVATVGAMGVSVLASWVVFALRKFSPSRWAASKDSWMRDTVIEMLVPVAFIDEPISQWQKLYRWGVAMSIVLEAVMLLLTGFELSIILYVLAAGAMIYFAKGPLAPVREWWGPLVCQVGLSICFVFACFALPPSVLAATHFTATTEVYSADVQQPLLIIALFHAAGWLGKVMTRFIIVQYSWF